MTKRSFADAPPIAKGTDIASEPFRKDLRDDTESSPQSHLFHQFNNNLKIPAKTADRSLAVNYIVDSLWQGVA